MPDLTCAELARRYKVARSTVARALAEEGAPEPVNRGEPQLRYRSEEVDAFWPNRRRVGRPSSARKRPCGRCGAAVGDPCRTAQGGVMTGVHAARRRAEGDGRTENNTQKYAHPVAH